MKKRVNAILGHEPNFKDRFFSSYEELGKIVEYLRFIGKKIVVTQGVYDLMHMGHIRYLEKAKSFGDVLIVGIDSDRITKMRKGEHRPAEDEEERAYKLAYSRVVDIVFLKEDDKPLPYLVQVVQPDVLVASSTTSEIDQIKIDCGQFCGSIEVLPAQAANSSSEKIRKLAISGELDFINEIVLFLEKRKSEHLEKLSKKDLKKKA